MKQYITTEQFNEIEISKRKCLVGFKDTTDNQFKLWEMSESHSSKLTIGKMIEILDNKDVTDIGIKLNCDRNNISIWKNDNLEKRFFSEELADTLWEAVKLVLEV